MHASPSGLDKATRNSLLTWSMYSICRENKSFLNSSFFLKQQNNVQSSFNLPDTFLLQHLCHNSHALITSPLGKGNKLLKLFLSSPLLWTANLNWSRPMVFIIMNSPVLTVYLLIRVQDSRYSTTSKTKKLSFYANYYDLPLSYKGKPVMMYM